MHVLPSPTLSASITHPQCEAEQDRRDMLGLGFGVLIWGPENVQEIFIECVVGGWTYK